jgi:hypothetical protein
MSYRTKPGYTADSQANITAQVPDDEDGAIAFAIVEQTAWQLSKTSVATVGTGVLATKSGVGRWLKLAISQDISGSSSDWLYGLGLDGARVIAGTAAALTAPVSYTNLELQAAAVLPAASQPIDGSGTLTLRAGSRITCNGNNAVARVGGAAAPAGQLAQATVVGANGGLGNSTGGNGNAAGASSTALGGNGGSGGNGGGQAGGAGGTAVAPVPGTVGRWVGEECIFANYALSTFTRGRGGANGGGGGGSVNGDGGGGGSGGNVQQVRFSIITVELGSLFQSIGGNGAAALVALSGGGGGGGGGFWEVFCDEWNMPGGSNYADFFDVSGGLGGGSVSPGGSGVNGSPGKVRLYVAGVLVYSLN